ncbi:putative membrane protein [Rickettsia argasii T170-B]|uniref:Putative membrane protein n=1 Tax=Rickettsia argasii T170-B TaxID=1268837 RepID=A0A0F3REC8_9RICK|nr:putative membrane protein [Rickettsia argasii T170-B]
MTLNHPEKFEYENVIGAYFVKLIIGKFCAIAMGTSIVLLSVILQR